MFPVMFSSLLQRCTASWRAQLHLVWPFALAGWRKSVWRRPGQCKNYVNHICNLNLSCVHILKGKRKQVRLILIIYFIQSNIYKYYFTHVVNITSEWNTFIFSFCLWNPVCVLHLRHVVIPTRHISSVHLGQVAILLKQLEVALFQVAVGNAFLTHIPVLDIASGLECCLPWEYQKYSQSVSSKGQPIREEKI